MKREMMGLIVKKEDGSEEVNYDDPSFPSYIYDGWIRPNVTWEKIPHFHEKAAYAERRRYDICEFQSDTLQPLCRK